MHDPKFAEFRTIFSEKYGKGNPLLAITYALNEMSKKECDCTDDRCMAILEGELRRVMSGQERATADDMVIFANFVSILNNEKTEIGRLFGGKGFDAQFFVTFSAKVEAIISTGQIKGVELRNGEARVNVTGSKASRVRWESMNTFLMNLTSSKKYVHESNLADHLSATHAITPQAKNVLNSITSTSVTESIMALIEKHNILPEILQSAMIFRALGDNGTLVKEGAAGVYHIPLSSKLGRALDPLVKPRNAFLTKANGEILLPFGNVSNLSLVLFESQRNAQDKPIRTIITSNDAVSFMANAVAFRFESAVISKTKAAAKH
jgi:hypothetical protein